MRKRVAREKDVGWKGLFIFGVLAIFIFSQIFLFSPDISAESREERRIRTLYFLSSPRGEDMVEYDSVSLAAEAMEDLGLDVKVQTMPWTQRADVVWYERERWDIAGWQMTSRPERLDPDEFIYNLFHSSTKEDGYNFIGYKNPDYDEIAEQQREMINENDRQELVYEAQEMLAEDAAYIFTVYPPVVTAYSDQVFDPDSLVEMAGLGYRNFWTYLLAEPVGEQQNMILNNADEVQAINPLFISGSVDSWVVELIYDRLMRMSDEGLPEPWAAESVKWVEDDRVEVVLREGMEFHDGEPVTTEDVKFSFEVPLTGQVPMYRPFVDMIEDIEIIDDYTLIFSLERPYAPFETASLANVNIIPKHVWEPIIEDLKDEPENAESIQEDVPIGSGPFKYEDWLHREQVILSANHDHFEVPNIDYWIMREVSNMEAAVGMLRSGELNFLSHYTGDISLLEQQVERNPNLNLDTPASLGYRFLAPNHRRPPFSDSAFRRAVAAATDRLVINQITFSGHGEPATSVIAPSLDFWHNSEIDYPSGGIEEARNILEEAGYEWDEEGRLLYPEGEKEVTDPAF